MSTTLESQDLPPSRAVYDPKDPFESTSLHISCTACKHFHRHRPLRIPDDDSKHVRVTCEKCGHLLLGLGRSSTQTTLASRDSIPLSASGRPPPYSIRVCNNSLDKSTAEHSTQANASLQLTPLTEQSPLPRSSLSSQSPLEGREERGNQGHVRIAQREDETTPTDHKATDVEGSLKRSKHKHYPRLASFPLKLRKLRDLGRRLGNRLRRNFLAFGPPSRTSDAELKLTEEGQSHAAVPTSGMKNPRSAVVSSRHAPNSPLGSSYGVGRCGESQDPQATEVIQSLPTPAQSNLAHHSLDPQKLQDGIASGKASKVCAFQSLLRPFQGISRAVREAGLLRNPLCTDFCNYSYLWSLITWCLKSKSDLGLCSRRSACGSFAARRCCVTKLCMNTNASVKMAASAS